MHYYQNLDTHDLADNKKVWNTIKHILTDKIQISQSINFLEKGEIISNDMEIVEVSKYY